MRKQDPGRSRFAFVGAVLAALWLFAPVFAAAGANDQAIQFFERALIQRPQDPDLIKKIAQSCQAFGEPVHLA